MVLVEKQRFGTVGDVQLSWLTDRAVFSSATPSYRRDPEAHPHSNHDND